MAITLLRHTKPDVAPGICYGRRDLALAATFDVEAAATFASLPRFERIVSSPLQRCRLLAELISAKTGHPLTIDSRLQEMDFGAWEGIAWADVPKFELDAWAADFLHARPHGGESVAMLKTRTQEALHEISRAGQACLVVTHAGVIKTALANGDEAANYKESVGFGKWTELPSKNRT